MQPRANFRDLVRIAALFACSDRLHSIASVKRGTILNVSLYAASGWVDR